MSIYETSAIRCFSGGNLFGSGTKPAHTGILSTVMETASTVKVLVLFATQTQPQARKNVPSVMEGVEKLGTSLRVEKMDSSQVAIPITSVQNG